VNRGGNLALLEYLDRSRVLLLAEGRDSETFREFRDDLAARVGSPDGIREICMGM